MQTGTAHASAWRGRATVLRGGTRQRHAVLVPRQLLISNITLQRQLQQASPLTAQSQHSSSRLLRLACGAFATPASLPRDSVDFPSGTAFSYLPDVSLVGTSAGASPLPLPRAVEGAVDDPRLHNPLQRQERLGTGWMGAILEYEGIVSIRLLLSACCMRL